MRRILHKSVDIALSMLAIIATVFANCQCTGRAYEPEVQFDQRRCQLFNI